MTPRKETIGSCDLWLGDCREIIPTLGKVDAVVTDPPYGVGVGTDADMRPGHGLGRGSYASYDDTLEAFREVVVPAIKAALAAAERGAVFCNHNLHELPKPDVIGGIYISGAVGRHCWGFNSFSPVGFYGVAPGLQYGSRPSAIWSNETAEKNGHPTPKPIGWMKWVVGHASLVGETILDPFMGSGTTGVACVKLGRRFIGVEIEPRYFDIACRRIEEATRQPDLFVEQPKPKAEQLSLLGAE